MSRLTLRLPDTLHQQLIHLAEVAFRTDIHFHNSPLRGSKFFFASGDGVVNTKAHKLG
jgi:hypothetical protein